MTVIEPAPTITLEGQEAIELWRAGKDAWNQWVTEHPVANISFKGVCFDKFLQKGEKAEFEGYIFPKGYVSFEQAKFGDRDVTFKAARFSDGYVDFSEAQFGSGDVTFRWATFGNGEVNFKKTIFKKGNINFKDATFGGGKIDFRSASFGKGDVLFTRTRFGDGKVRFRSVAFGKGDVIFNKAEFGSGTVSFHKAQFGKGDVRFEKTIFGIGDVKFYRATFEGDLLSWKGASLNDGHYSFQKAEFNGHVDFSNLKNSTKAHSFNLDYCTFKRALNISFNHFDFVLDITKIKGCENILISKLRCNSKLNWYRKVKNPDEENQLRYLRNVAEKNKDHDQALALHSQEMCAKRWQKSTGLPATLLDITFGFLSLHGQSASRPALFLAYLTILFASIYLYHANKFGSAWDSMLFSATQALPFIRGSRLAENNIVNRLYEEGSDILPVIEALTITQGALSFILIFLIGLALRNRFRL